ncbi:MAG: NAD(+) kinase [Coxiella sp. (in: Bacteria)]|nr:MAG: NAD(+) kinase [Coxiella sp. (in: g-proteobacteria)]
MTKKAYKHILLIGRPYVPGVPETLSALKDFLLSLNVSVTVEELTAACMNMGDAVLCTSTDVPKKIDLIIVVGGDGSLLNAAHIAIAHDLPIIGVHRGRLGFLTDIHPNNIETVADVIAGNIKPEQRFLLKATLYRHDNTVTDLALNDVVLMPGNAPQMIEFETHINDEFVCKQRADGLIIATPTGSTAYALSAGGPILNPGLNAIVLVPMCPHTLSSRPLIVDADSRIELIITDNNKTDVNVSCDGIQHISVSPGDRIVIERYEKMLNLIHPSNYSYFSILREKLGWEKHAERT